MSLLLLFGDDGGTPPAGGGTVLDCLVDVFWMDADAECAALTGAFAKIPSLSASAQITGHAVLIADIELHALDVLAFMESTNILDCTAAIPQLFASMRASRAQGVVATVDIPCVSAAAEINRGGAAVTVDIFIPCIDVNALIADASGYDFGGEGDLILRYDTGRRLI